MYRPKVVLTLIFLQLLTIGRGSDDDDDTELPVKMIKDENYPVEVHSVVTEDHYILTVHRIPGAPGSTPVYMQHGLLSSSADWLIGGKNDSLAYYLWDNGYDVWMGNARGNTYSRGHKNLTDSDSKFWDFSFHEVGYYDVPASIDYIANLTNSSLFYVGFSMGASTFSVMATQRNETAKNVKAMVGVAPATFEFHIKQPLLRALSRYWRGFRFITNDVLRIRRFLCRNFFFDLLANKICTLPYVGNIICNKLIRVFEGSIVKESLTPLILKSFPAGTSLKLFSHWLQQMSVNEFQNFDYGPKMNMQMYGEFTPPKYNLSKIEIPVALFYSDHDRIVSSRDVRKFYQQLPNKLGIYKVDQLPYGHADFLFGVNTTELVHEKVLKVLQSVS